MMTGTRGTVREERKAYGSLDDKALESTKEIIR